MMHSRWDRKWLCLTEWYCFIHLSAENY